MSAGSPRRRSIDAALLKTIVEQFIERDIHPAGDLKPFEELALGLIDRLDPAAAADILRPLHAHPDTPMRVRARLRELSGDAVAPAMALGAKATCAPPSCKNMKTPDSNRLRELAADLSLNFDDSMRRTLARAARTDLTLARILLDRDDLDLDPAAFFLAATRLERQAIVLEACRRALIDGCDETLAADPILALRFQEAASARNFDRMAELAATTLNLYPALTRMIVADATGEALALLLVALGFDAAFGAQIFLSHPVARTASEERTQKLLALMRATPRRAARQIMMAIGGKLAIQQSPSEDGSSREIPAMPDDESDVFYVARLSGVA